MRIAYVLKQYPKISETFILGEMLELERQGEEVHVFALSPSSEGRFHPGVTQLRAPVHYLKALRRSQLTDYLQGKTGSLRAYAPTAIDVLEELLESQYRDAADLVFQGTLLGIELEARRVEHIHAHFATVPAELAWVASRLTGIPFSFTAHAKDIYHESVDAQRLRALASAAAAVVTVCDANQRFLKQEVASSAANIVRLYNGVDLEQFQPNGPPAADPPLILGVGRLVEKKGFRYLVEAVHQLQRQRVPIQCTILGEGRERAALEKQIAELGAHSISLPGACTQEEVRNQLGRAAITALPCIVGSDGNRDALPTILLESLASGVPVVSTPVVGVPEILDGGRCGQIVAENDATGLAQALSRLLEDPQERQRSAQAGRELAEHRFDRRKNVAALRRVFRGETLTSTTTDPARAVGGGSG